MEHIIQTVAGNLRHLREDRGLSLSELSRISGVGKATLSALEAANGNPTVETLWALANALGVAFGDLIAPASRPPVEVLRAAAARRIAGAMGDVRLIDRLPGRGLLEVYEMVLGPDGRREAAAHAPGVREHLLVTHGRLLTGPASEPVELGPGDAVRFPGDVPHVYAALGGAARAVLWMQYPAAVL